MFECSMINNGHDMCVFVFPWCVCVILVVSVSVLLIVAEIV